MCDMYTLGAMLAMRDAGFYKEAGIRDFLRFLMTGRSTAYHGTSKATAEAIREGKGLIPRHSRGVIDVGKEMGFDPTGGQQLAFLTRSRPTAKTYATQQGFIEGAGTKPIAFGHRAGERIQAEGVGVVPEELKKFWSGQKGAWGSRNKGIVKARYPAREFKPVKNPESDQLAQHLVDQILRKNIEDTPRFLQRAVKTMTWYPFRKDLALAAKRRGAAALPSRYITGSSKYQRTTLPEVKEHLRHAVQNPKETAYEALRNLTGWQYLL